MSSHFFLDGQAISFLPGQSVLEAVLASGRKHAIPYFCFHPALGSLGACRQCAVKLYPHDNRHPARIMMACLLPASPQLQLVSAENDVAEEHKGISELLMRNHPHDCPVCDEGGQCHLQDMTVRAGQRLREYRNVKRRFQSQNLGPLIRQEMNRCITCYRCVRFYQDIAGGTDFGVFGSRDRVFFGRLHDGTLESPFAGNLAEICPTGVFTDKVYHGSYLRPWDLESAPSLCPHCNLGCNTTPGAARGQLRRMRARSHPEINPYFLCDRGRFGFRAWATPERPCQHRYRGATIGSDAALDRLTERLAEGKSGFLGSPRADLWANLAWLALADTLGAPFAAFSDPWQEALAREILAFPQGPSPQQIGEGREILVIGQALEQAPSLQLAVRAALRKGARLTLVSPLPHALDSWAQVERRGPDALVDRAVHWCHSHSQSKGIRILASAAELGPAGAIVLRRLLRELPEDARVYLTHTAPNLAGAAFFATDGQSNRLRTACAQGQCRHLLVLAADPLGRDGDGAFWRPLQESLQWTVLDHLNTDTAQGADLFFPLRNWAESDGVFINGEGRFQAYAKIHDPQFEEQHWDPSQADFPLPAGGMIRSHCLWEPTALAQELARRLSCQEKFQERLRFYGDYLCPQNPTIGSQGFLLTDALRARFRIGIVPTPHAGTGAWLLSPFHWWGEESQAQHAPELQGLAPAHGIRLAPQQVEAAAIGLRSRDGRILRFPVVTTAGMAPGTLALAPADLSQLGYHPGERLDIAEIVT